MAIFLIWKSKKLQRRFFFFFCFFFFLTWSSNWSGLALSHGGRSPQVSFITSGTKTTPALRFGFWLSEMLVCEFKNQAHLELRRRRMWKCSGRVSAPRAGCSIVAVVEEAEPQLWIRAGLNSPQQDVQPARFPQEQIRNGWFSYVSLAVILNTVVLFNLFHLCVIRKFCSLNQTLAQAVLTGCDYWIKGSNAWVDVCTVLTSRFSVLVWYQVRLFFIVFRSVSACNSSVCCITDVVSSCLLFISVPELNTHYFTQKCRRRDASSIGQSTTQISQRFPKIPEKKMLKLFDSHLSVDKFNILFWI